MNLPKRPFIECGHIFIAHFLERPNRFLIRCEADELGEIEAHLPNPGRLWELLLPGAKLYLHKASGKGRGGKPARKTEYTVLAVERGGQPIFLQTHATNQVAQYLVEKGLVPPLTGARIIKLEVRVGRSRFDFLLQKGGQDIYMEVKSCTLFGNGVAMFPDAVTQRGRRHLVELSQMGRDGTQAVVLFVVHCPHVQWFMPDYHTDLDFSATMLEARNNVQMIPVAIEWEKDLTVSDKVKVLEIPWDYLEQEVKDQGSYLLFLRLKKQRTLEVGKLKRVCFPKGYYIYVGSAVRNLSARIARHQRRPKNCHWHIDYVTQEADHILPLPVRSSEKLECEIAGAMASVMQKGPAGFGSSDCSCDTHLFWSKRNPIQESAFHQMLQSFRMKSLFTCCE